MSDFKSNFYSIYDTVGESYSDPFVSPTDAYAIRLTQGAVLQPGSMLHDNPDDFRLVRVGTFTRATGVVGISDHSVIVGALGVLLDKSFDSDAIGADPYEDLGGSENV